MSKNKSEKSEEAEMNSFAFGLILGSVTAIIVFVLVTVIGNNVEERDLFELLEEEYDKGYMDGFYTGYIYSYDKICDCPCVEINRNGVSWIVFNEDLNYPNYPDWVGNKTFVEREILFLPMFYCSNDTHIWECSP